MALSLNQIIVRGRLGRDGETKFSRSGAPFTKFSVATDYGRDEKKVTTWHNVTLFGEEETAARLVKGAEVMVFGRQTHTSKDGKHYSDIIAEPGGVSVLPARPAANVAASPIGDDDVPF
jgi:single-stranded DNA-binding protein